jgi:hypothetical protein
MFDEARQCITKGESLGHSLKNGQPAVSQKELLGLQQVLRLSEGKRVLEKDSAFFHVIGMCLDKRQIAKAFGVAQYNHISASTRRFIMQIEEACVSGRNLMTVKLKIKQGTKKLEPDFTDPTFTPFTVMRPTELFYGYGEVTLMSAMFKDSQMWNILAANEKHIFKDLLADKTGTYIHEPQSLKSIRKRHEQNLELITKRLVCIPLTAMDKSALSLTYLNGSVMLPLELDAKLAETAARASDRANRPDLIKTLLENRNVFANKALSDELRKYAAPPLWIAMCAAYNALKKAGCEQALLFINAKGPNRIWEPAGINYIDVIRDAVKYDPDKKTDEEHLTAKEVSQKIDPIWINRIKKMCHGESAFFITPRTTSVKGLNKYSNHTGYVHLAALNQDPDMYNFFACMLPNYDVDLDNVIDNIMQTLYRTNIRVPESDSKIYMVTSNQYAMIKLAEKVFKGATDKEFNILPGYVPKLTTLTYKGRTSRDVNEVKATTSKAGKHKRKYSHNLGKEIQRARISLAQAKTEKTKLKWKAKLTELLSESQTEKHINAVRKIIGIK